MIFYVFLKKISHQNQNIILKKFKGQRPLNEKIEFTKDQSKRISLKNWNPLKQ